MLERYPDATFFGPGQKEDNSFVGQIVLPSVIVLYLFLESVDEGVDSDPCFFKYFTLGRLLQSLSFFDSSFGKIPMTCRIVKYEKQSGRSDWIIPENQSARRCLLDHFEKTSEVAKGSKVSVDIKNNRLSKRMLFPKLAPLSSGEFPLMKISRNDRFD